MKGNTQKRFGSIAVEKDFITPAQLKEALEIQAREDEESGKHRLIGQILMEKGYLTESQLDEVLETISNSMVYKIAMGR